MSNSIAIKETEAHIGDMLKVSYHFTDGDKKKDQVFEGVLIKIRGRENNKMFTVRKMSKDKIGIERIFPVLSPFISKVEVVKKGFTNRSKLYFIRNISEAAIRERVYTK